MGRFLCFGGVASQSVDLFAGWECESRVVTHGNLRCREWKRMDGDANALVGEWATRYARISGRKPWFPAGGDCVSVVESSNQINPNVWI
jgi:hypothetical protein